MRNRRGSLLVSFILVAALLASSAPSSLAAQPLLRRWFGAEGGFEEISCFGLGTSCPAFSASYAFDGQIGTRSTHMQFGDSGFWDARSGNRLFLATVPGATPSFAYLSTSGSAGGPVPPGTVSFAFMVKSMPAQSVVIFNHGGTIPGRELLLSLLPDGRLSATAPGWLGVTDPVSANVWHVVTVSHGSEPGTDARIYIDNREPLIGDLPLGGPDGHVSLGITLPTSTPFTIAFDDYVESATVDAPIRGARIDYLMPLGTAGASQWQKSYPNNACQAAAKNWQLVSEDQFVSAPPDTCNLGGGSLVSLSAGETETLQSEGIPSKHKPSSEYFRKLWVRPSYGEPIHGVRLRIRGRTDTPAASTSLSLVDAGAVTKEDFLLPSDGAVPSLTLWGPNHALRANGQEWDLNSLGGAVMRLEAGSLPAQRVVLAVRIDFVWIPSDISSQAGAVCPIPVCE